MNALLSENEKSQEHCSPFFNFFRRFIGDFAHTLHNLFKCTWLTQELCLGEEFVGKANELFLKCLWDKILYRQIPPIRRNHLLCKSCTCMTFTHPCMTFQSMLTQQLCPKVTMTEIILFAKAEYTRCIGQEYTDIVKHGSFINKLFIKAESRMTPGQFKRKIRNCTGMNHVNIFQLIVLLVIEVYYAVHIHNRNL